MQLFDCKNICSHLTAQIYFDVFFELIRPSFLWGCLLPFILLHFIEYYKHPDTIRGKLSDTSDRQSRTVTPVHQHRQKRLLALIHARNSYYNIPLTFGYAIL